MAKEIREIDDPSDIREIDDPSQGEEVSLEKQLLGLSPYSQMPKHLLRDLPEGLAASIQNTGNLFTRGKIPRATEPSDLTTGDKLVRGLAGYAPFGALGGAGLLGGSLAGAAYGYTQAEPENRSHDAIRDALINMVTHGIITGAQALKPSNMFGKNISPEKLERNVAATKGTETHLGEVLESPFLKRQYENILSKVPFSGVNDQLKRTAETVHERGKNILSTMLGNSNPDTVPEELSDSLIRQFDSHQALKNKLYDISNEQADKANLKLELPNFSKQAKEFSDAIEQTNMLKYEPDIARIYHKLVNYKEPTYDKHSMILNESGKPFTSETVYPSLKEANLLKGKLNHYANVAGASPDPALRNMARIFGKLATSLKGDIRSAIDESGNADLKQSYKSAEDNYAKNFSTFLDKLIYKHISGKKDPETLVADFISQSRTSDRGNLVSKLVDKLPPDEQKLLGYAYFSRALNKEGDLNATKLGTLIDKLGKRQFNALVPDKVMREQLANYSKLTKMNSKALNLMYNPPTGQQALDILPGVLGHAGSSLAGGALGGLPGALAGLIMPGLAARPLTKLMTSPEIREKLVKSIIENKNKPLNKRYIQGAQAGLQSIENQ